MKTQKTKPIHVIISDLHFTPTTLDLATEALVMAKNKAIELKVPLVLAGDTLDSKAIMRGECVNRLINIFTHPEQAVKTYVLVGNHDLLNEKGKEHTLEFLKPYVTVVDQVMFESGVTFIPYQNSSGDLESILTHIPTGGIVICHQGVLGAHMGHYVQDKTSLPPEKFANFRTISGHYHKAQDIKCGRPRKGAIGLFSYVGTSYTTSFSEANDAPKGFKVLYDNGLLELVPTNLRKHVILEFTTEDGISRPKNLNTEDLLWVKVSGPTSKLSQVNKKQVGAALIGHDNFRLELTSLDRQSTPDPALEKEDNSVIFDFVIDSSSETLEQKAYLKSLWRDILDEAHIS